mgnify:CR=1 FL=1
MLELLAAAAESGTYKWLKWAHVLGMVVYVGGFLTLTRLMGRAVAYESAQSRADAYRTFRRMHKFVDWGGFGIMLVSGVWLLVADPAGKAYMKQGYFHMKLTFVLLLVGLDVYLSMKLFRLDPRAAQPKPSTFKVIHGAAGLALVAVLIAVFVIR